MYLTAKEILDNLEETKKLDKLIDQFSDYQLVITGHSLGAGVASVVALLLKPKPKYSHLVCYAFSPPGCVLRFVSGRCFLLLRREEGREGREREWEGEREYLSAMYNVMYYNTLYMYIHHYTCSCNITFTQTFFFSIVSL